MKLMLNHTQRLNLHALWGAQRADVRSIRTIWAVQDKLALNTDEGHAIELQREPVAGQESTAWNPVLSIRPKELEFTDREIARIKGAIANWGTCAAAADGGWLEPLLGALAAP